MHCTYHLHRFNSVVRFRDAPDIEARIIEIIVGDTGVCYRVAWWNNGSRECDVVAQAELLEEAEA
jgi:hypothetical protein